METYSFAVDVPPPFDFELTVKKPAGWYFGTPFELYERGALFTAVRLSDRVLVGLKVRLRGESVRVDAFTDRPLGESARAAVRERMELGLGVDDDLDGFYALADRDPLIAKVADDLHGMRLGFLTGVFERALLAITLQMAPLKRSLEMRECLIKRYGEVAHPDGREVLYWPAPAVVAGAPVETLKFECKLGYRAKAVHAVAVTIDAGGFPDVVELYRLDEDEIVAKLQTLYGIGTYAAQIMSPKRGFPLDVWSARVFHEILRSRTPEHPRDLIGELSDDAERRWGEYRRYVFAYVLNDLKNLQAPYGITKLS